MSQVELQSPKEGMSKLVRGAIYIAIGALVLAAVVCVVWVFVPDQGALIGRAFLTVLLLSGFSGAVLLDANLANKRPDWLILASTASWIIILIVGAFKIWVPRAADEGFGWTGVRVWELLLVIGILQLALVHQRLYWKAHKRYVTVGTQVIVYVTTTLLVGLVGMLAFYLAVPRMFDYTDWYWRIVVALAILASVGTLMIPLLNALFAPRPVARASAPAAAAPGGALPWPTFPDGRTPLPYLPNGQPDFEAARTGVPSQGARFWGTGPAQPQPYPGAVQAAPRQAYPVPQAPAYPVQPAPAQAPGAAYPGQSAAAPAQPQAPAQQPQAPAQPGGAQPTADPQAPAQSFAPKTPSPEALQPRPPQSPAL